MPESDLVRSGGSSYQIEHGAIVRTRQSRIEPLEKLAPLTVVEAPKGELSTTQPAK